MLVRAYEPAPTFDTAREVLEVRCVECHTPEKAKGGLGCISQVTATPNKFKGLPRGARAVQIADGNASNYFLTTLGRATRATVCSCEVKMEPDLSQALHLLNGDTTQQRIRQGKFVETLLKEAKKEALRIERRREGGGAGLG